MTGLPELPLTGAAFRFDVAVIGAAVPAALAFHEAGRRVVVAEPDPDRLAAIRSLDCGLAEPDRDRLREALASGSFTLTGDPAALGSAQTVLVGSASGAPAAVATAVPGQLLILTVASRPGCTARQLERPLA
ncbi:MAG: UDP-N-acetyl-D-glucosamine dehydrogenase, partial [Cryptosporangiaceae bacterium]|nr:UDP-N-acetyl-D-glucosamine dehydrogenase [Cryptosporangiaceae bacterium]